MRWFKLILLLAAILTPAVRAQPSPDLSGRWEGTLDGGAGSLRLLFDVTRTADGIFLGVLTSLDQGQRAHPRVEHRRGEGAEPCALEAHPARPAVLQM